MAARPNLIPARVVVWLISLAVIAALVGCAPKLPASMSGEDLLICDDTAASIMENFTFSVNPLEIKYKPWWVTPGEAEIISPLTGGVFPFEPLSISFTQPPADPNVSYRLLEVFVTPFDTVDLSEVYHPLYGIIPSSYTNLEYHWTPESSGNFIILVMFWNLKNGGDPDGLARVDYGPPSMAYVCVKINPIEAGQVVPPQPGTVMPIQNVTILVPSVTRTSTLLPSATGTPTLTPSSTATSTITPRPPTRVPPTPIPPTPVPPTAVVSCSSYTDARSCWENNACQWVTLPSGGEQCENKP